MKVDPTAAGFCPAKLSKLDHHLINRYTQPKKMSGFSLKVVRKGKVAHHTSAGLMDIERNRAMHDDTIFDHWSRVVPMLLAWSLMLVNVIVSIVANLVSN